MTVSKTFFAATALLAFIVSNSSWAQTPTYPDNNVCATLKSYVDENLATLKGRPYIMNFKHGQLVPRQGQVVGAIFGVYVNGYVCYFPYGRMNINEPAAPTPHTLFEIGSISKTFTAILIAQDAYRYHFHLSDPIKNWLPAHEGFHLNRAESGLTFQELATHTAGFPHDPPGLYDTYPVSTADLSEASYAHFIDNITPPHDQLPAHYSYSNTGFALLGQIALHLAGEPYYDYGTLVSTQIAKPLDMLHTGTNMKTDSAYPMAIGYSNCSGSGSCPSSRPIMQIPHWPTGTPMDGGSALRSDAADMVTYIKTILGANTAAPPKICQAIATTLIPPKPYIPVTGWADHAQALAWEVQIPKKDVDIEYTKNGSTFGFSSIMALDPAKKLGLILLSNTNNASDCLYYDNESYSVGLDVLNSIPSLKVCKVNIALKTNDNSSVTVYASNHQIISQLNEVHPTAQLGIVSGTHFVLDSGRHQCAVTIDKNGHWKDDNSAGCVGISLPADAIDAGAIQLPQTF